MACEKGYFTDHSEWCQKRQNYLAGKIFIHGKKGNIIDGNFYLLYWSAETTVEEEKIIIYDKNLKTKVSLKYQWLKFQSSKWKQKS